ncbi:MAG: aminopeptidase P family protein [Lachnospiraceae bacterium]|nr:aminopeptidase P family protein [Lachnospiraceae bacterium]
MNTVNEINENLIPSRLSRLKDVMHKEGITMYMVPTADPHDSEYVGEHYKFREYLSGFTGSNGTLIVTDKETGLWTDGRYFIQAENELKGSGITLFKMGEKDVPTVKEYIRSNLKKDDVFGIDGRILNTRDGISFEGIVKEREAIMRSDIDLADEVWEGRPKIKSYPVTILGDEITGENTGSRIKRVREKIQKAGADAYILSRLDDICWLMNIRGRDIECNPVVQSYVYMTMDEVHIFILDSALTDEARVYFLSNDICIHPYDEIIPFLKKEISSKKDSAKDKFKVYADLRAVNYAVYTCIKTAGTYDETNNRVIIKDKPNPTELMEAVRNETELKNIRETYLRDSAALTRFLFGLKKDIRDGKLIDEYTAAMRLDDMRARLQGFMELSFPTISAYGANAAMMHYEATECDHSDIRPEGMYLVDSGGQYLGGTTDVTRTIALGPVTDEMRRDFTLVCVGMLKLADSVFMEGCTGRNLDILARGALWKYGTDYKCGTGHGVGYILGVHTGPQNIRYRYNERVREEVLKAGMTLSDEPGVYIEGKYGIRTENILEVKDAFENSDGRFLKFEHLTYVPIDLELIDTSYMEKSDVERLNRYHESVREKLYGYMETEEERIWLERATASVTL